MWASDIADRGYEVGTFKIGQTVYRCIKCGSVKVEGRYN